MPRRDYYLPERKLVNQSDAAIVATPKVPRSKFVGSWTRKTAIDAGWLYPIMVDEVLPGDHLTYDVTAYVRMATPLFPIFDNQRIDTHFFFVPCRLVWDNWERMLGAQDDPGDTIAYQIPEIQPTDAQVAVGDLFDHMGIPVTNIAPGEVICINALPFRAYNLIYNEWFRDQNLQNSLVVHTDNGIDPVADYDLVRRAKFHDYFTSALPWPQKFTAPTIPLSGFAPVTGIGIQNYNSPGIAGQQWDQTTQANVTYPNAFGFVGPGSLGVGEALGINIDDATGLPTIYADLGLSNGTFSISDFREAMLIQELLERDARGGTRYIEIIKNHFGVTSADARLQRPEYIGGGQTPLIITPIAQTTPEIGGSSPLGTLGGAGSAAGQHHASYAATEHGYIIGLLSIRSELSYEQGMHKMYQRETNYDFYRPTLAGLSEQAIKRAEIFQTGVFADDEAVWGYQERWQEYRTRYNEITGIMRPTAAGSLSAWHLGQEFSPAPALNAAFIVDNPPMDRVLAAGALAVGQQYLADIMYRRTAIRPIPTYGIPASLTRF